MLPQVIASFVSEDVFIHAPKRHSGDRGERDIIFFVCGNPGLLGYYDEFLSLLSTSSETRFLVAGFSLGGFDVSTAAHSEDVHRLQFPPGSPEGPLYSLADQIDLTQCRIKSLLSSLRQSEAVDIPFRVVLIGHSVGAYIALEVIRRVHEEHSKLRPAYTISGAVLITPTIIDIAKSSHGRIVTPLLTCAPFLDNVAQWTVWGLVQTLPGRMLEGLVGMLTGMKREKLQTTLKWLRSERGVKQTVFMGGQEMQEMGADAWGEEVWGAPEDVGEQGWRAPKLALYFAKRDQWIGDATRDEIVRARGKSKGQEVEGELWPRIEIEESGRLVHGWCLEQSKEVAEKVRELIQEILGS